VKLADVFRVLREREAVLYVDWTDGTSGLRYVGVSPLRDDELRAGIAEHRAILIELFTYAPDGRCVDAGCYRLKIEGQDACSDHEGIAVSAITESCGNENGVCQDQAHEHFNFDEFFDDYRAEQEDRHVEGVR
jgi:hypothetical protein